MTRQDMRKAGEGVREALGGGFADDDGLAPGFRDLMSEMVYASVWDRPGLARRDRMICALAALCQTQRLVTLERYVGPALDLGLGPRGIQEIFIQCGLYGGFPIAETALEAARRVFSARGVAAPEDMPPEATLEDLSERGEGLLGELHGARARQGYADPKNATTGALYGAAIQYAYGELWFRPGLERRERFLVAVASFATMRLDGPMRRFAQSALAHGLTREQIIEAVIQTAPYAGFPPTLNALASLGEALPA